jgi:hypothetical protein
MKNILTTATLALFLATPLITRAQENVGTSCADCANYSGAFSIENPTGVTISYEYRWGNGPWKHMSLQSGHTEKHSYPLGDNRNARVPTPYVRFDRIGGDAQFTPQEYQMHFYSIGYGGYGSGTNNTEPKKYYFKYADDHRTLDLFAR